MSNNANIKKNIYPIVLDKIGVFLDFMVLMIPIFISLLFLYLFLFLSHRITIDAGSDMKSNQHIDIDIVKGSSLDDIIAILLEKKIINNTFSLKLFSFITDTSKSYKSGHFEVTSNMSRYEILFNIINGITKLIKIQICEGLSNYQVVNKIISEKDKNGVINDLKEVPKGYLFPNTYHIEKYSYMSTIITMMLDKGSDIINNLTKETTLPPKINNIKNLLILSSIVEKEKGIYDDPSVISGVFINRLKINMRLEADPTLLFALTEGKYDMKRRLTNKDKLYKHPCNTYYKYGLPNEMIANPGIASIQAVLNYTKHDYYYFVTDGEGKHNFAKTITEQNKNIQHWKARKREKLIKK